MLLPPEPNHVVWFDNQYVTWQTATLPITAHHYGIGVFEGVRAYQTEKGPAIFRLQDHTKRLLQSAKILNIPVTYTLEQLNQAQCEVVQLNKLQNAYLRPFIFYNGLMGFSLYTNSLQVHAMISAAPWNSKGYHQNGSEAVRGVKLHSSALLRQHPGSVFLKAKANGNYMNAVMALQEARAWGADDALLFDQQGLVAEASGANLFMVRKGVLYTPDTTSALEGITRNTVFVLAKELGLEVKEKAITRDELYIADEVFLTGTAVEILPVFEIDKRKINTGNVGKITEQLRKLYFSYACGVKQNQYDWLTYVSEKNYVPA